jgi:GntR family transcriptional regulator/MocR family aminotransferase
MNLAAQVVLDPGQAAWVEDPGYPGTRGALIAAGASLVPVPVDAHGLDVSALERLCLAERVRGVYVTPHHQFPTTVALRPERRLRLLELARQFDFALIEDDYDHEFHFESQPLLPMASYAPARVIYVGSLSKLLLPALRIGYIAAPPPLIDAIAHQVSLIDGMGNSFTEDAAAELIESGELRRHARKATQVYAERRAHFATALGELLGGRAEFRVPDGGLAFWLRFPEADMLDRIERAAPALGLRFANSRSFATSDRVDRGLRLGFASLTPEEARNALGLLARAADA